MVKSSRRSRSKQKPARAAVPQIRSGTQCPRAAQAGRQGGAAEGDRQNFSE